MKALLDVNVLLALLDAEHIHHNRAWDWLDDHIQDGWASCAITQNGFIRIISQPRYDNRVTPTEAIELLEEAVDTKYHSYWNCDISAADRNQIDRRFLLGSKQLTDSYLLALAVAHDGIFLTLDQGVELRSVPAATKDHLVVVP